MRSRILLASLIVCLSGGSQAELHDRGGGMIYDDVLNITWLQNANLNGQMNWDDSVAWANGLSFEGFEDWRLPSADVNGDNSTFDCISASEMDCRDTELGYMLNLGGSVGDNLTGAQGLITNIQLFHWSGTERGSNPDLALSFNFGIGDQGTDGQNLNFGAWAVRDGDVFSIDVDGDGVFDALDNCTLVANPTQRDTDGDGFGNRCDADFDQNCVVNFIDLNIIAAFFLVPGDFDTDLNGDGVTNFLDISIFVSGFLLPPGPSALTNDCDGN